MDGVLRGLTRLLGMAPESGQDSLCCESLDVLRWRALELLASESSALEEAVRCCRAAGGDARRLLGDFLIQFSGKLSEIQLQAVDDVYMAEGLKPVSLENLDGFELWHPRCKVLIWKGDITRLATDAVVNAANEEGRGCFQPMHRCIDNVLHRAAGPRLRIECTEHMRARKKLLAGTPPLVTKAYHLPSKAVLHVTGPQISPGSRPSSLAREQLRNAYTSCLDAAKEAGLKSVAFCCISTGLFGYPAAEAADIALTAVWR
ncbi:Protein-ADP-ribose hydrolase, partial [Durusdinium trenchii]